MKSQRPVNLDLTTIKFPITAIVSITHRISGGVGLVGILLLFWMFDLSLRSEDGFQALQQLLSEVWFKVALWLVLSALAFHFWMGVRHFIMDLGFGESLRGGQISAKLSLVLFVLSAIAAAGWVIW